MQMIVNFLPRWVVVAPRVAGKVSVTAVLARNCLNRWSLPTPARRTWRTVEFEGLKAVGHNALFRRLAVVQVRKDLQNALFAPRALLLLSLATGTCGPTPSCRPLRLFALAADVTACSKWHIFFN